MLLTPNTRLGRYHIRTELGQGGMGEVYLAWDSQLERIVAIKILPAAVASDRERLRRFIQEAKAAAALNHPAIATIYEIGEADGTHFISMEYVDGQTLRHFIYSHQTELPQLIRYLQHAALGLTKAHASGIVHRDLKPDNIMITGEGHAKILDFGLAKLLEPPVSPQGDPEQASTVQIREHTQSGMIMGTVGYMSPEQARGQAVDQRSDIFSFGCILFEAATRHRPFEADSTIDTLHKIIHAPAPALKEYTPLAPAELQRIVRKCLAKDPEERYQSIKDVAIDLKELRREMAAEADMELSVQPPFAQPAVSSGGAARGSVEAGHQITEQAAATGETGKGHPTTSAEYLVGEIKRHKRGALVIAAVLILVLASISYAVYWYTNQSKTDLAATAFREMKLTRLTTTGKVYDAVISPDGKYVAYVERDGPQQSLWLRQVATSSTVQMVPPADTFYVGLTFSPDNNYIYYVTAKPHEDFGTEDFGTLCEIPVLGGAPRKLLAKIDSGVSFSPDGKRFAFIRSSEAKNESDLMIVNADGTGEQKIAQRQMKESFAFSPAWSPDGKVLACAAMVGASVNFLAIEVESGAMKPISEKKWTGIGGGLAWLKDASGLLMTSRDIASNKHQIWQISYPSGEARRITSDLNDYWNLSVSADSSALVSVQRNATSSLWIAPNGDAGRARQIAPGNSDGRSGLSWTPDNRLVYASEASGKSDLWIINADGTNQKQLTVGTGYNAFPAVSPDGRHVVFYSRHETNRNIWRIDIDGSNPKQLTMSNSATHPSLSPDGQWVIYESGEAGIFRLWKVSIDGSTTVQITEKGAGVPSVSPDGKQIACIYLSEPNSFKLTIISFESGQPLKVFDTPLENPSVNTSPIIHWTPDGRAISYRVTKGGVSNIWAQPVDGGAPKQLTDFKSEIIYGWGWSRDGKQLALSRGTETNDVVLISNSR